jgi:GH25 family lysozyme M1 (1,4-beta-N-acetylmuramidase)
MARAHGIDISHNQDTFDPGVNREDIQFVIVRPSNGVFKDRRYAAFLERIADVPVRGAYHYFRSFKSPAIQDPGFELHWKDQADLFLELVRDKGFHFLALDFERSGKFRVDWTTELKRDNILSEQFAEDAQQWLSYVDEQAPQTVMIYTNQPLYQEWLRPIEGMRKWPLWIAQYHAIPNRDGEPDLPEGVTDWRIWQYSADGNMKGKEYGVGSKSIDLNVYNGTLDEMRRWLEFEDGGYTWRDVIIAVKEVGEVHGERWERWLREAKATAYLEDPGLLDLPYSGPAIESWPLTDSADSETRRAEILKRLKEVA